MAKSPTESKIPIFHSNPLKSKLSKPLSTLSSRLRAHLDADNRTSPSSVLFGFLNATSGGFRNVNGLAKNVAASSRLKHAPHHLATSYDDLKSTRALTRPTDIRLPANTSPVVCGRQHSITGVEHVGRRVRLNSGKEGVLRFVGKTQFGEGVWCGVELDRDEGTSDGVVNSVRYFTCPKNRGLFVLISNVSLVEPVREYVSDVSDSGPHSLLGVTGEIEQQQQQQQHEVNETPSDGTYFRRENAHRCSSFSLQETCHTTPSPNSSNGSYVAPGDWKSRHSSSASSLVLNSLRGLPSSLSLDPLSVHMSKHSSIECEDSLGILTPDQMAELTVYNGDAMNGGSCDDFRSLDARRTHLDMVTESSSTGSRCPSMENMIVNTPMPAECMIDISDGPDRLFSEHDTFMTSSSISDQLLEKEGATMRSPSMEELLAGDDLSSTLIAVEQMDSTAAPPPTSFVTSVTSIGSWDNGYQGDGECSRPTSRGADASPQSRATKMALTKPPLEPMTDSDFFTESDADLCDDSSVSCLRGDRKARVIDGKLFGSPGHSRLTSTSQSYSSQISSSELYTVGERSVPEEMDSSGIFSDLEKRNDGSERMNVETNDAVTTEEAFSSDSSKSVSSQKLVNDEAIEARVEEMKMVEQNRVSLGKCVPLKATVPMKLQNGNSKHEAKGKDALKSVGSCSTPKARMPRRNVASKVKATLSASNKCSEDENQENQPVNAKPSLTRKAGKWDSVLSKIEKSKTQEKLKAEKLKDVKSKVLCNASRVPPSKLHKDVKPFSPNGNAINGSLRQKENTVHRFKTRKTRNRMNGESPLQSSAATTAPVSLSRASSRNSSVTDISDSHMDISQHSLPAVVIATGKKTSSPLCSPLSESGVGSVALRSIVADAKDLKIAALPDNRSSSVLHQNRLQNSNSNCSIKNSAVKSLTEHSNRTTDVGYKITSSKGKLKQSTIAQVDPLLGRLKRTTDGMEAFIVLFQRLTADMDVFTLPYIKRELAKYKKDWLDMKLKLEEANVSCRRLKEEAEMQKLVHDQKLEEVRETHSVEIGRLKELHEQELGAHSEMYEKRLYELEERLKSQESTLHSQFSENLRQIQRQAEEKLESILEETKNQVDVLKLDNDAWKERLMKESWKKLEQVEAKYKTKMERMETCYLSQLNEADEEARKREELFLTSMSTKRKDVRQRAECNSDAIKSNSENSSSYGQKNGLQNMEDEVCSLRVVLELKHSEIQDLRKQNEKLRKDVQDLPFITQKLDSAQARIEDLNAQLQTKIESEKKLLRENRKLLETVQHESEKKKRLTFQNEELLWKLKKSAQVAKTLAVFKNSVRKDDGLELESEAIHSTPRNPQKSCRCHLRFDDKSLGKQLKRSRTDADIKLTDSPPNDGETSPKVLGVVEKNDSVSWVLEMDESPLAVASRMLRRASSLRGVPSAASKKKSAQHTQHSLTLPSRCKKSPATSPTKSTGEDEEENDSTTRTNATVGERDEQQRRTEAASPKKQRQDDENVMVDISSFFAFLQDSDCESDLVGEEVFADDHRPASRSPTYSTSRSATSSDSSMESDAFVDERRQQRTKNGGRRYTWTKSDAREKARVNSSGTSDTTEENNECFLASPAVAVPTTTLNQFVNSTNVNE